MSNQLERSASTGSEARRRLVEVDRVTGFAIFLVVLGHVVARQLPEGNDWYGVLKFNIYLFHMPLFMFVSGLVFRHTHVAVSTLAEYRLWARRKIARLAPGFLLVGTLIVVGKSLASGAVHVDNMPADMLSGFVRLFVQPTDSAAASLWYIYVLLQFYLLFPLLIAVARGREALILPLVVAMHVTHLSTWLPKYFALEAVFEYSLYFWLGATACSAYDRLLSVVSRGGPAFLLVFAASFVVAPWLMWPQPKTLVGLASIPAIFFLIGIRSGSLGSTFARLGAYSFVIYLLNTLVIGATKGLMLKLLPWDGPNFLLYFVVLTSVGLGVPILAYRRLFVRNAVLARIMN